MASDVEEPRAGSASGFQDAVKSVTDAVARSSGLNLGPMALEVMKEWGGEAKSVSAVGIDTNVIGLFVREPQSLGKLQKWVGGNGSIPVVIPAQAFQESWNNVLKFAKGKNTPIGDVDKAIKNAQEQGYEQECLDALERARDALDAYEGKLNEPDVAVENLKGVYTLLEEGNVIMPAFPRTDALSLYQVRFGSKTPPGFEDVKDKGGQHYGDFALWLDFLLGLKMAEGKMGTSEGDVVLITQDKKPDWYVDKKLAHPMLCLEVRMLLGRRLVLMDYSAFEKTFIKGGSL